MRLVTYSIGEKPEVCKTDGVGIARLSDYLDVPIADMPALITAWPEVSEVVRAIDRYDLPLERARLKAPILRPGKIFGIGLNYADHVAEASMEMPTDQIWFTKAVTSVNGPFAPIELPRVSARLDYEAELVVIIGKRCRHVDLNRAQDVIFGYSVGNDVSVRDWQMRTSQFVLGKSFDTHAPFGPWIMTADAVDAADLGIRSFVNGELRQDSRTRHLIFDCAAQIAYLSQAMTLEPGDILFTGTPGGVGAAMKPPKWLVSGDSVRVEIDEIGAIENTVIAEPAAPSAATSTFRTEARSGSKL
jgi:2-keto-4-pentenoate hydratase/2-oxohepta-3-ene-1,7-dioic acid hydratase in catechol pathway